MFRGKDNEHGPVQSVGSGGKNFNSLIALINFKINFSAEAFADPVGLHGEDLFRPFSGKAFASFKKAIRIVGYFKKPTFLLFLHYFLVTTPATTI